MRRLAVSCRKIRARYSTATVPRVASIESGIAISWPDGRTSRFHNEFLLDHCRCSQCFHPQTKQRLKLLTEFEASAQPHEITPHKDRLDVQWAGQHTSSFPWSVLAKASYDPPLQREDAYTAELWGSCIAKAPPTVQYEDVMSTGTAGERSVLKWLDLVDSYGFCFVKGVPADPVATEKTIQRIARIRETHYGGFYDFTADMAHGDLAYSNQALPAHTDTTYFTDPAGLQIFHLLSHLGKGGESLLVDGFRAASMLSEASYKTLSRLSVPSHASGNVDHQLRPLSRPVLIHDHAGKLVQVRWNNEDRGILGARWTPEDIVSWYKAAREFETILRSEESEYWNQLEPGTMVVIDNWRVMHGRASFTGSRRMCGAYIGADDWRSRRRALRNRFNVSDINVQWDSGW